VLAAGEELDPAGAVTARTVEAGPSHVGEGTPSDEEGTASRKKRGKENVEEGESGSEVARKRGKRSVSVDSDELDHTPVVPTVTPPIKKKKKAKPGPLKPIASTMVCGECDKNFTVVCYDGVIHAENQTAYTKEHPQIPATYLCVPCCYNLGINPFEKAKKAAAKKAGGKDDRAKIVHYEERKGVVGLSDLCIEVSTFW
jgi:DNA repair protein RAD7